LHNNLKDYPLSAKERIKRKIDQYT